MNHEMESLKLIVLGKTGVGKSTFCNFLFGHEKFESGVGKPVTSFEENFQCVQFKVSDIDVEIYDTVGIEATNFKKWEYELDKFIGRSYGMTEKIHGILYVINASSDRIEDFEETLIKQFTEERNFPVIVVLTHIDIAKPQQIQAIRLRLAGMKHLSIAEVCTVQKKLRGGRVSASDDELKTMHQKMAEIFLHTSGRYYIYNSVFKMFDQAFEALSLSERSILQEIENSDLSIFNIAEWGEKIDQISEKTEDVVGNILSESTEKICSFEEFSVQFEYIDSDFIYKIQTIMDEFSEILDELELSDFTNRINLLKAVDVIDDDSAGLLSKLCAACSIGISILTIKSTLKKIFIDMFLYFRGIINEKSLRKLEKSFREESWSVN